MNMEQSTMYSIGTFLIIVLMAGLFWFNTDITSEKIISLDAQWFEFTPNEIKVAQGEKITLIINNMDVDHGINIPELGISENEKVTFVADKKGEFYFYCNNFCGVDHDKMIGKIIIE